MKHSNLLKISIATLLFTLVAAAQQLCATVIYEDDFTGTSGTLNLGRHPTIVDWENNAYLGKNTSNYFKLNGSGQLIADRTAGGLSTSLLMPEITTSSIVTVTMDFRTSVTSSGYIGLGFTNANSSLAVAGEVSAVVWQNGRVNVWDSAVVDAGTGIASVSSGITSTSSTGVIRTEVCRLVMTLDATGEDPTLLVTLTGLTSGVSTTIYNGIVSTDLDALNYLTIQFSQQLIGTNATPQGYVDYINMAVTTIPEASATAFVLVAALGVLVTRSRRNRA